MGYNVQQPAFFFDFGRCPWPVRRDAAVDDVKYRYGAPFPPLAEWMVDRIR